MMKCSKCGCEEFYAAQACRGTVTVIACVDSGGTANFVRNPKDVFPSDELDFDDPEGPFECVKCGTKLEIKPI